MPRLLYLDPNNNANYYLTTSASDAGIPAGYVLQGGADGGRGNTGGTADRQQKQYTGGTTSGGYPTYSVPGDPHATDKWPNGHLSGAFGEVPA